MWTFELLGLHAATRSAAMSATSPVPPFDGDWTIDAEDSEGIAELLSGEKDVEIFECDKTGNIQQRWLHTTDNRIIPVISLARLTTVVSC